MVADIRDDMMREAYEQGLREGFRIGFMASHDGHNGENYKYGFASIEKAEASFEMFREERLNEAETKGGA